MAVNGWIIERTVDLAHPPKTLRNEQPYEITYTGDMANPVWVVHVLQNGQPVALDGSVKAYIKRIDGAEVISDGTINDNTVSVELGGSNFGQPGYTWGILRYTDSTTDAIVTLDALTMIVQTDPEGTSVLDPDDMLPTLQELLAELDEMREATEAAEEAAGLITDVKDDLQLSDNALYQIANIDYTTNKNWKKYCRATQQGSYAPGALVSCNQVTDGFYSDLIPVGKAEVATAYSVGGGGVAIICFYDSSENFVSAVPGASSSAFRRYSAAIPANAAYVRFSGYSTTLDLGANCEAWIGIGSGGMEPTAFVSHIPITANTDLDDLTKNGAYLLFNGYTYTHAPSFYTSGQAWIFVYDALTVDGYSFRLQVFVKSSNKYVATRTYTTSEGSGSWGDWTEYTTDESLSQSGKAADASAVGTALAKTMHAQAAINENTDLDNITNMGFYLLFSGRTYTHAPEFYSSGSAWLFVYDTVASGVNFRIQFFMKSSNKLFAARTYTTSGGVGSWGDWVIYSDVYRALLGKKISFVGDSISTYKNYIPSNYIWYYPQPSPADVDSVNKTWWKQVIDKSGMTLLKNASWSGSRVSWISGTTGDEMAKVAYTDARIGDLADGNTTPDIVIVLIGTNDFANSIALGTLDANTELPAVSGEITDFRAAYAAMINNIRTTYPHAHVYCCTLIQRFYSTDETYPIKNAGGNALALYNRAIMDVAEWMGCEVIRLDTAISLGEVADYTIDGRIHPNAAGMIKIADKVLQKLVQCEITY